MANIFDGIKPGDSIFVVSGSGWLNRTENESIGTFMVTRVNGSSFYAHHETDPVDAEVRFSRKTAVAVPFPGTRWIAHLSEQQFNEKRNGIAEHGLFLAKVQAEAKNLTTEELKKTHEFMRSLMFAPNRKRKGQSK